MSAVRRCAWQRAASPPWQAEYGARPSITSIHGDTIVLDGTTVEEVERYHRLTLMLAVTKANAKFAALESDRMKVAEAERLRVEEHRRTVAEAAKKMRFHDEANR